MKKTIAYCLGSLFVITAVIISFIFVFSGEALAPQTETLNLSGKWTIAATYDNDSPTFSENQFIIFSENMASMYKDNQDSAYTTSKYVLDNQNQLTFSDISKTYKIDKKNENCIRLYESSSVYLLLIKDNPDTIPSPLTVDMLKGKWTIDMKGDQLNSGELLEFNDNVISYYKDASVAPSASSNFVLSDNGTLRAEGLNISMKYYIISENTLLFIEDNGIVWQVSRFHK